MLVRRIAALAPLALVLAGCGGGGNGGQASSTAPTTATTQEAQAGRPLTASSLVGEWLESSGVTAPAVVVRFRSDGTFALSNDKETIDTVPAVSGTFKVAHGRITLTNTLEILCVKGQRLVWEVTVGADDELNVLFREVCGPGVEVGDRWVLKRNPLA
jgi:hypothetical protein